MGCVNSKKGAATQPFSGQGGPTANRRRLSLDAVNEPVIAVSDDADANRGDLKKLTEKNIIELADAVPDREIADDAGPSPYTKGRRVSIGSETDKELNNRHSFKKKDSAKQGDDLDEGQLGIGYTCRKGLKPESPNQDSWSVFLSENDFGLYGVFDGHGARGHDVSNFVKENLPKLILSEKNFRTEPETIFKDSFLRVQKMIEIANKKGNLNAQLSGCTTTVVLHDIVKDKLYVSHVGDSRAVLIRKDISKGSTIVEDLTIDHKPDLPEERSYIESNGGRVAFDGFANHRVYVKNGTYPGLNMSRALGDILGSTHAGINNCPDVSIFDMGLPNKEDTEKRKELTILPDGTRCILVICSDGVWEFISSQQCKDMCMKFDKNRARDCAEVLAKEAWDRWIREESGVVVDDITAMTIYI